MKIGKRIKEIREGQGMSQTELSKRLHVTQATISSWEVERTEPSIGQVDMIAKALGISKSELLDIKVDYTIDDIIIEHIQHYNDSQKALLLKYMELLESNM